MARKSTSPNPTAKTTTTTKTATDSTSVDPTLEELNELGKEYLKYDAAEKAAKEAKSKIRERILEIVQARKVYKLAVESVSISYTKYSRKSLNQELFKAEHPKMFNKYVKENWFYSLHVKPRTEEDLHDGHETSGKVCK